MICSNCKTTDPIRFEAEDAKECCWHIVVKGQESELVSFEDGSIDYVFKVSEQLDYQPKEDEEIYCTVCFCEIIGVEEDD